MRSAYQPEGFDDLSPHREEKVRLGNALAQVAVRFAEAQEKAGNYGMLEQPATSLMWLLEPIANLIAKVSSYMAVIDVCMYGAPWREPTALAADFEYLLRLVRRCNGTNRCRHPFGPLLSQDHHWGQKEDMCVNPFMHM